MADVYGEDQPNEHTNKNEWVQNYQLYIGDDPVYSNNPKCPGGPFMRTDDSSNYTTIAKAGADPNMWNYGKEHWCNMEGQYMHFVGDLSHLSG